MKRNSNSARLATRDIVKPAQLIDNRTDTTGQMDRHLAGTPVHEEPEYFLTVEEVSSRLRMSKSWVYKEAERKALPHIKVGKTLRFQWSEVMASLKQRSAHSERRRL